MNSGDVRRWNTIEVAGVLAMVLVVIAVAVRLTVGVDLGDESFYASFIDDWLKEGVRNSPLITVTQTAALLVYPFTIAYHAILRSSDGLLLFCRYVYLGFSVAAAFIVIAFARQLGMRFGAWAAGMAVVAFVPFGLPAPSYNNFALQGLLAALSALGCAALTSGRRRAGWYWVAGVAATVASIAYPPMIVPLVFAYGIGGLVGVIELRAVATYGLCLALGCVAVFVGLGPSRIESMITAGTVSEGLGAVHRFTVILQQLTTDVRFVAIWVGACILGVFRFRIGAVATSVLQLILLAAITMIPPPLFIRSHVAVFVVALTGIALLANLRRSASVVERAIAFVYAFGLAAAATTTLTTSENGLFNFAIGGFPAALAALLPRERKAPTSASAGVLAMSSFVAVLLWTSLTSHYGELGNTNARERITRGWYAGIWATPERATLIRTASAALGPLGPNCTLAVVGLPAFYLLSPCVPRALMAYPINDVAQHGVFQATLRYYADPAHLPQFVVEEDDQTSYADFPFPDLHHWFARYHLAQAYEMPFDGVMRIYKRVNANMALH